MLLALKFQELIVAAGLAIGKLPANRWPGLINSTASRISVEKSTDGFVYVVFFVPQDTLVNFLLAVVKTILPRIAFFGLWFRDIKVLRKPCKVAIGYDNAGVAAAVGWALAAVVAILGLVFFRHDRSVERGVSRTIV